MERSEYIKTLDSYEYLADYYDELLQDEDSLYLWLDKIKAHNVKTILELASGSGVMASLLKNEDYQIKASDISSAMQRVAKKRFDGEYLLLNMIDFNLEEHFDMIICFCDSINYLNDYSEMEQMFKTVYSHLNDKGVFLFDMHHPHRLKEFKEEYIEEGFVKDVPYQWTILADEEAEELSEHFVFYDKSGMIEENHSQKVFDPKKTAVLLQRCGFKVTIDENFIPEEKVLIEGVRI